VTSAGCCTWNLSQHEGEGLSDCIYSPLRPSSLEFAQGQVQGPALLRVESPAHLPTRGDGKEKGEKRRGGEEREEEVEKREGEKREGWKKSERRGRREERE
jgi:hypothetical protein